MRREEHDHDAILEQGGRGVVNPSRHALRPMVGLEQAGQIQVQEEETERERCVNQPCGQQEDNLQL